MSFTDLSPVMQNLILYNYDSSMKLLFLFTFYFISIFYLFYYKLKVEKPTALWSVMILRVIVSAFSFFGLVFYPVILLTLDPNFTFSEFFQIYGYIYLSIVVLIMFIILLDFSKWGFILFLRMMGIKGDSQEYNKFRRWYKTYINPK